MGAAHGLKEERKGIGRHQQSTKGGLENFGLKLLPNLLTENDYVASRGQINLHCIQIKITS